MIKRAILMCLGAFLLVLGLIGLVIPILPGVLFLVLAAVCFSATSPKFQARLERHPAWRGWRLRWRESRGLPLIRRIQLAFWLTAEAASNVIRNR
jgi:uncharacterized membrane protein YbaN (DUF454 family)